jgi:hypothetical protein
MARRSGAPVGFVPVAIKVAGADTPAEASPHRLGGLANPTGEPPCVSRSHASACRVRPRYIKYGFQEAIKISVCSLVVFHEAVFHNGRRVPMRSPVGFARSCRGELQVVWRRIHLVWRRVQVAWRLIQVVWRRIQVVLAACSTAISTIPIRCSVLDRTAHRRACSAVLDPPWHVDRHGVRDMSVTRGRSCGYIRCIRDQAWI